MTVGLSGSHRVGKSTLAKAYAEREGIHFVQTTTSQVFEQMGLNPAVSQPLAKRIEVQQRILDTLDKQYSSAGLSPFIADRTPLDCIAYTMVELGQEKMTLKNEKLLSAYFADCIECANNHFSIIAIVRPGINLVSAPGKASLGKHYIDHLATIIDGLATRSSIQARTFAIPRDAMTVEERVDALGHIVDKALQDHHSNLELAEQYTGEAVIYH